MEIVVVIAGAVLTIGSAAIGGWRLERWAACYVRWMPQNVGAPMGLAIGIATVVRWLQ